MKRTILVVLMVFVVATPCFAQKIDAKGISSLHGTVWEEYLQITILPIPSIHSTDYKRHFYGGRFYNHNEVYYGGFYVDLLDVSFSFYLSQWQSEIGIMLPASGSGISMQLALPHLIPFLEITLFNKIGENWTPPGQIISLSPDEGEQGTILTDILLTCIDTTIEDDGVSKILFTPPDGLTVSNISVISNTEVDFDLEIAVDAPVEPRGIYVVLGDSTRYYHGDEVVFEILGKKTKRLL